MFPVTSVAAFGGYRALIHTPPRGTCSRILSLRLHRRSRVSDSTGSNNRTFPCHNVNHSVRGVATATNPPGAISDEEFALFHTLLRHSNSGPQLQNNYRDGASIRKGFEAASVQVAEPTPGNPIETLPNPFRKALEALQQRDTRRLLIYLQRISVMEEAEMHEAVAALPRTTFTEFLRSLDPLCVARDVDPTNNAHISFGMYQTLNMDSVIDIWGIRKLYTQLLQRMLALVTALKASGQILLVEAYTYLLRCAGAASDPTGAKLLWRDMDQTKITDWRQTEAYVEFLSARFLTKPLYTGFDKVRRIVDPRNLHKSRILLRTSRIHKLDRLRFNIRRRKLRFGLNKETDHAEDMMRKFRKNRSATRLFQKMLINGLWVTEPQLCAAIIAFGRAGSLRFISSRILARYFGIRMRRLTYQENILSQTPQEKNQVDVVPYRIRPTTRLMQAIVETYGSNGEIAIAFQLVDHISKIHRIPIPLSIWQDLLEWAHIMNSPAASTAWKLAGMHSKIANGSVVELIWEAMVSHRIQPGFEQYNILIRNLLGRHQFSKARPLMGDAIDAYRNQCQQYEQALFVYVQMLRDGVRVSEIVHRYEQARFTKAKMFYDIQMWCRQFLSHFHVFKPDTTLANVVPDFIHEFQEFVPNQARYRTATGYVTLFDPARVDVYGIVAEHLPLDVPVWQKGKWVLQRVNQRKLSVLSRNSMAGHAPVARLGLVALLAGTSRIMRPSATRPDMMSHSKGAYDFEAKEESSYDDDDDW
ncbi:hypothetical protein M426DRAFT_322822 [Hypoxylon sp. CI-4A]|nr:hypothetical protein M426DRAFT_322822 [Hypoxylon sp. CI-4A]